MSNPTSKHSPRPVSSKTTYALAGLAVLVVAAIVAALYLWNRGDGAEVRNDGYGPAHDPAVTVALDSDGALVLGKPNAKTIDIYEDPLCPACGQLEKIYGQEIAQQVDLGKIEVRYRLVSFLDPQSKSKDYSTRAVAANECVAQAGNGPVYAKFHSLLFTTEQPTEGGPDHDNKALAILAQQAGAGADVAKCITSGERADTGRAHAEAAKKALDDKLNGRAATPSVFIDGKKIDVNNKTWVLDAAK
ncbi:DsbA family protein [Nocardia seriolae]|uniref:DsbA family protein n=1 Tax=Nocardia seriolae TaxID=37332 RepID=UPI00068A32A9|nr:thioredoxin domain-containing protein [Nocardia seriolae]MTJ61698.1 thioredoxin domain-containing protein [Nocardia seriolae]MTJ75233.1 thioredoxin domain-containing protein [Nocardia seriolae]MTJ86708.1 thioredoxin domain-containing protein [Nocardia seriolae]MTK30704.1 thioredoxin domain-containing protein [Nocardia seriolae]MTK39665.1 thioredoxin domain-containing protein [Nocardia seriolae]